MGTSDVFKVLKIAFCVAFLAGSKHGLAGSKHGGVTWLREYWLSSSLCRPGTHLLLIEACRIKV